MEEALNGGALLQLGVGAIFVLMVLDRVVSLVRHSKGRNGSGGVEAQFRKMGRKIDDVHNWAGAVDAETGERRMYTNKVLVREISEVLRGLRDLISELRNRPCLTDEEKE